MATIVTLGTVITVAGLLACGLSDVAQGSSRGSSRRSSRRQSINEYSSSSSATIPSTGTESTPTEVSTDACDGADNGPYSMSCLRQLWNEAGCSQNGLGAPDKQARNVEYWNGCNIEDVKKDMFECKRLADADESNWAGQKHTDLCFGPRTTTTTARTTAPFPTTPEATVTTSTTAPFPTTPEATVTTSTSYVCVSSSLLTLDYSNADSYRITDGGYIIGYISADSNAPGVQPEDALLGSGSAWSPAPSVSPKTSLTLFLDNDEELQEMSLMVEGVTEVTVSMWGTTYSKKYHEEYSGLAGVATPIDIRLPAGNMLGIITLYLVKETGAEPQVWNLTATFCVPEETTRSAVPGSPTTTGPATATQLSTTGVICYKCNSKSISGCGAVETFTATDHTIHCHGGVGSGCFTRQVTDAHDNTTQYLRGCSSQNSGSVVVVYRGYLTTSIWYCGESRCNTSKRNSPVLLTLIIAMILGAWKIWSSY